MSDYLADTKAPVCRLEVKTHFELLTEKEKRYAHHISRASHWGTRVVLRQVSPEAESIYDLILEIEKATAGNFESIEGVSAEDLTFFLEYAAQFLSNGGNYKSFGDVKFVPRLPKESFAKIASVSPKSKALFENIGEPLYSTASESANLLGYPDKGHVTSYYSSDITEAEVNAIQAVTAEAGLMPENTRVFKTGPKDFELRIASADLTAPAGTPFKSSYDFDFGTLKLVYGDHTEEFKHIYSEIEQAIEFAANDTQVQMLKSYAESFKTGSMEAHKDSQKFWVKDIGPKVETNIGFIETYRDPSGVRGEWEGLVAMVNKERTEKFGELVNQAKNYISQLPWPKAFEKDVFTPPDFTSLEVLTFAGSGIPAGINIPNYDDVRLNIGFKNVSLGNVLSAKAPNERAPFLLDEDWKLYDKLSGPAFEVQVGIHELLGHGTGKLLSENRDGTFNFDKANPPISPITGKPVTTYYKKGETWGSLFGAIAGSYEECRAEAVAMYLATDASLLKIFGHGENGPENGADVLYIAYLQMARAGIVALEFWDPKSEKWGQPHMQARFSILKTFLEAGFVEIVSTKEDYSDLAVKVNRDAILTVGKEAIGAYLQKLHIYKTTADLEAGKALYEETTRVTPELAKYRPAVLAAKLPRKQFVQANTQLKDGKVEFLEYEATTRGLIQSFVERAV